MLNPHYLLNIILVLVSTAALWTSQNLINTRVDRYYYFYLYWTHYTNEMTLTY